MRCCLLAICGLLLGGWLPGQALRAAEPASLKTQVTSLLDAGWDVSSGASRKIEEHYASAQKLAPDDSRALYALFLAQLKQRRYREAGEAIDKYLQAKPEDLSAWQARIWLDMFTKKYSAALLDMERMSKLLPSDETIGEPERPYAEAALFLGKMTAYLHGPLANALPGDVVDRSQERIAAALSPGRREQFDTGLRAVQSRFAELQLEHLDTKNEAVEQQNREKEEERLRLAAERSAVEGEKASIDEQANQARAAAETAISGIAARRAPLDTQFAQLDAQASSLRSSILSLNTQVAQLRSLAASTKDPQLKASYQFQADQLALGLVSQQGGLQSVEIEASRVNAAIAALEAERSAVVARYEAEMQRIGRRAETLQNTEKRISVESRQVNKPATGVTGTTRAISSTAAALTTYHPFPFEAEKHRLLDSFE